MQQFKSIWNRFSFFAATGCLVGCIPSYVQQSLHMDLKKNRNGSGFLGTCLGLGIIVSGYPLMTWTGFFLTIGVTFFAVLVSDQTEKLLNEKDDSKIIIDEIVGFMWSVVWIPLERFTGNEKVFVLMAAFVLFRFFDVFKIPFKRSQNLQGGWGVVADDFLAGVLTNVILQVGIRILR